MSGSNAAVLKKELKRWFLLFFYFSAVHDTKLHIDIGEDKSICRAKHDTPSQFDIATPKEVDMLLEKFGQTPKLAPCEDAE